MIDGGNQLDFGPIVDRVGFEGARLHPTNDRAYQTPSGLLLMADGRVAEAATPPVSLTSGFVDSLEQWAVAGHQALTASLENGQTLFGESTHLSVEVDPDLNEELCAVYAQTFAPALMLLLDRADSPGLLIRPRPSRTELCGEFIEGARLRAAIAFAAGSVIAVQASLRGDPDALPLPAAVDVVVEPARQRHGWYIDRAAFGPDLYEQGRAALLRLQSGGSVSAQDHLAACWKIARATLARCGALAADLAATDDVVASRLPLPSESAEIEEAASPGSLNDDTPHARALAPAQRPGFSVAAISGTWDYTAFEVRPISRPDDRAAVVNVPERQLDQFLDELDRGALDEVINHYLVVAPSNRVLKSSDQTTSPGIFDSVNPNPQLMPPDQMGVGFGTISERRPGKRGDEPPPSETGSTGTNTLGSLPWGWISVLGAVAVVAAVLLFGGGSNDGSGTYSVTDPLNDFAPSFINGQPIENPSNAGDVTNMQVVVAGGNTTVTVTFDGNAQGLQTEGGEELAAGLQFIPVGNERFIDILFGEDGSVKISDQPSGASISSNWAAPNTLVFEITGLTPAKGATVRFETIQRLGFGHSTDEVLLSTGDEGSTFVTPEPVNAPPTSVPRAVVIQPCDVIDSTLAASLAGTSTQPTLSGNDRRKSCDYPNPPGASEGTGIRLVMGVTRNTAPGILRTYRNNNDGAVETRPVAWSDEGEMWIHINGTAFSKVELLAFVDVAGPAPVYVTITMFGPAESAASMAAAAETISGLLNEAVLAAQP